MTPSVSAATRKESDLAECKCSGQHCICIRAIGMELSKALQKLSNEDLAQRMAGFKPTTQDYILCQQEFIRRQNAPTALRAWVAIGISVAALVVSILVAIFK